jgi:hypothetical protein
MVKIMKNHINASAYESFYITKDISYQFNNPLDTRRAPRFELNIKRYGGNSKISRNSRIKFFNLTV